ncbi:MAG TPA: GNAT family N-acetyltransferase [Solirubrobacteraceae bacterium]|jgi:GNAT superfamily N-acetyltransferase
MARIRDSRPGEAPTLEALQHRAAATWPEYRDTLAAHPDAIAIPQRWFDEGRARVAEDDEGRPVGFAVTVANELDSVYVDPEATERGIGRALVEDAAARAKEAGEAALQVSAIVGSERFYARLGFVAGGEVPSRFGRGVRMRREL